MQPIPEWRVHAEHVLQITVLRHRRTRAATELESPTDDQELDDLCDKIVNVINCDWRKGKFMHLHCNEDCPCGGNLEVCVELMVSLVLRAVIERLGIKVPASNKWWTIDGALESQTLGFNPKYK